MTVSPQPDSPATSEVIVRDYAEGDYGACRSLWTELTEYHRSIYGDPSIGRDDPGAGFDDYLATPQRMGSWVAESHGRVIGLTGLRSVTAARPASTACHCAGVTRRARPAAVVDASPGTGVIYWPAPAPA